MPQAMHHHAMHHHAMPQARQPHQQAHPLTTAAVPPVHLTRRGQLALVLALAALLLAVFSLHQAHSDAATAPAAGPTPQTAEATPPTRITQTTVHAGDTLWSVARRLAPDRDARQIVAELRALNVLPGGTLRVGQQLLLPAYG